MTASQALPKKLKTILSVLMAIGLLTGLVACDSVANTIDLPDVESPAPVSRLPEIVEAYLQEHQATGNRHINNPQLFQTTYIYDRNGILLAELFNEGRRAWVSIDRISPHLIQATIATEDASFYDNPGVDLARTVGAALQNAEEGEIVSGASTITMQLARNLFLSVEDRAKPSIERKVSEVNWARQLTVMYTKDELLEMYLNMLNYGRFAYGPEAAAQIYFGKSAASLTLSEATFLAGLPQQPATLNPYKNFPAAKLRQRIVLNLMVRHEFMSQDEADAVYEERLVLRGDMDYEPNLAPHFVQYLVQQLDSKLGQGFTARSGLHIYTTLDLRIQRLAEAVMREKVAELQPEYGMSNAALVAMRPGDGEVLALVGSLDFNDESIDGQVNVALSRRQPGSVIKPIFYATALSDNLISPASVLWDTPVIYDMGADIVYQPLNFDNKHRGLVTVRTALANSYNVPIVKLLNRMGIDRGLEAAQAMGVQSLTEDQRYYGLSLALGGGEVRLIDMATAYHTMANRGRYVEPKVVRSVRDSQFQPTPLITKIEQDEPVQVISPEAAFLITDIMSDNAARAPTFPPDSPLRLSRPAAAKTGTTTDWRDNWTIGYTPYLLAGVWVGNSDGRPMIDSTGASGAGPIWNAFMEAVIADLDLMHTINAPLDEDSEAWNFIPPDSVEQRDDCPPRMTCRIGGEYFGHSWLETVGWETPLADTFVTAPTKPVHPNAFGNADWPFYCNDEEGVERTLMRLESAAEEASDAANVAMFRSGNLPSGGEFETIILSSQTALQTITEGDGDNEQMIIVYYPDEELARFRALSWVIGNGIPITMGDCADLEYYTVQSGDYWSGIANRMDLSAAELQAANLHVARTNGILRPGDKLLVPKGVRIEIDRNGTYYTVHEGDTWFGIADLYGIDIRLLQAVNPDLVRVFGVLLPGDEVFIPKL
ncbi:MAG: transglycosylase domain-containing protein [Chloroflexota bacterium]